jgi:anthranilate phosphoribosyltransferase
MTGTPSRFDVGPYLKRVGRGNVGARSLEREEMQLLFGAMLDGQVGDVELGGLLVALRMKGESLDEILGALAALQARLAPVAIDPRRPVVAIPSYNGARKSPNLTPLLAGLLADAGVQVIIHGIRRDPNRITTCQVIQAMGHSPAATVAEAALSLERGNPAFVPIDVLAPSLGRLLQLRERLGVRHVGHTLAKLLAPIDVNRHGVAHCVRLMSFTHADFNKLQHEVMEHIGARAVVMRGSEGEAVAGMKRMFQVDLIERGATRMLAPADRLPIDRLVVLPPAGDAVATAAWVQAALSGEQPVPENVARQVALVLEAIKSGDATAVRHPQAIASTSPQASPQ